MAYGALGGHHFDASVFSGTVGQGFGRQRQVLERLRREVEELDEVATDCASRTFDFDFAEVRNALLEAAAAAAVTKFGAVEGSAAPHPWAVTQPCGAADATEPAAASRSCTCVPAAASPRSVAAPALTRSSSSTSVPKAPQGPAAGPGRAIELEERTQELDAALAAAELELREVAIERADAKAEWSRALSRAAAAEGREERRLLAARRELEELQNLEAREAVAFRGERERLRQRLRGLRMRARQASRRCAAAVHEEALCAEFQEATGPAPAAAFTHLAGTRASASGSCLQSSGALGFADRNDDLCLGSPRRTARLREARRSREASQEDLARLRAQLEQLLAAQRELEDRERSLRRAARLSGREVLHLQRLQELRVQEGGVLDEQATLRDELRSVEGEEEDEQQSAAHLRLVQERAAAELVACDRAFQQRRTEEGQAIGTIDRYLSTSRDAANPNRQASLAEWIEADISLRQVGHMRQRLAEIVEDAGARARALEQAIAELHSDLDRRAAIILELIERRQRACDRALVARGCGSMEDPCADLCISPSTSDVTVTDTGSVMTLSRSGEGGQGAGEADAPDALERQAMEAELKDQRVLFDLRSEQVQGLEHRLAALLAREAPRVHALRTWIAVHEPMSAERLQQCLEGVARDCCLREEVEAMREDKREQLASMESEWKSQRQLIVAAASRAKRGFDELAARLAALQLRKEQVSKVFDRVSKTGRSVSARLSVARDLVDRDQQKLVDAETRRLRAGSAQARWRPPIWSEGPGGSAGATAEGQESGRYPLAGAREVVEAARTEQLNVLGTLRQEAMLIAGELLHVEEAAARATAREEHAASEVLEAEALATVHLEAARLGPPRQNASIEEQVACHGLRRAASPSVQRLEQQRSIHDQEWERTQEQMQELEQHFEQRQERQRDAGQRLCSQIEECREALEAQRAQQRSASSSIFRHYRSAELAFVRAEENCADLQSRQAMLDRELSSARLLGSTTPSRKSRQRRPSWQQDKNVLPSTARSPASQVEGCSQSVNSTVDAAMSVTIPLTPPGATSKKATFPSLVDVRDAFIEKNPELYTFYLQVFPLLQGVCLEVFRRASNRYEPRQLTLSADFQRLEVWPILASVGSDDCGGCAVPAAARCRRRIAEAFLRVDALQRLHVPQTTLMAVRQASGGSPLGGPDATAPVPKVNDALHRSSSGSPGRGSPAPAARFPFDLLLCGAEPWRLLATDMQTFQLVICGISALLAARASLPSFAVALGLGAGTLRAAVGDSLGERG